MSFLGHFFQQWAFALSSVGVYRRWLGCFLLPLLLFSALFMSAGFQLKAVLTQNFDPNIRIKLLQAQADGQYKEWGKNGADNPQTWSLDSLQGLVKADSLDALLLLAANLDSLTDKSGAKVQIFAKAELSKSELRQIYAQMEQIETLRLQTWYERQQIAPAQRPQRLKMDLDYIGEDNNSLKSAVKLFLQLLASLLGLLMIGLSMWSVKYLAIHQWVKELNPEPIAAKADNRGHHLARLLVLFFVNNVSLLLVVAGLALALNLPYNPDSAMLVGMIKGVLGLKNLMWLLLLSIVATVPVWSVWVWLFSRVKTAYWAGRWANFFYSLWIIALAVGFMLLATQEKIATWLPVLHLPLFVSQLLNQQLVLGKLVAALLLGLLWAALLLRKQLFASR